MQSTHPSQGPRNPDGVSPGGWMIARFLALGSAVLSLLASLTLSLSRVGVLPASLPGCATDGGCSALASSQWATLPLIGWPWSHAGSAWFASILTLVLIAEVTTGSSGAGAPLSRSANHRHALVWLARLGSGISLGLLSVMLLLRTFCLWCAIAHVGSLAFWWASERLVGRHSREQSGPSVTTARMPRPFGLATGALVFVLTTAGLAVLEGRQARRLAELAAADEAAMAEAIARRRTDGQTSSTPPEPIPVVEDMAARLKGRWAFGVSTAPIEIVVFSDYQCPDCRRIESEIDAIVAHGDVSVTPRHFPLCSDCNRLVPKSLHPDACRRALLAEAAGQLGGAAAFRAAHTALFAIQGESESSDPVSAVAVATGLDRAQLLERIAGQEATTAVADDIDDAVALGVTFTPMVFVNGREWKWYQTRSRLVDLVDRVRTQSLERIAPPSAAGRLVEDWQSARRITSLDEESLPPFLLLAPSVAPDGAREGDDNVPHVRLWLDYTLPGSGILDQAFKALASEGLRFRVSVYQFPASSQCNDMRGLPVGTPESCLAALAAAAGGIVGGESGFRLTHDWLIAHPNDISLAGLTPMWDTLPGERKAFTSAYSDGRAMEIVRGHAAAIVSRAAVTAVPIVMVDERIVPRWDHPGAPAIDVLRAIVRAAAVERASPQPNHAP